MSETGAQPVRPVDDGAGARPSTATSPAQQIDGVPRLGLRPSLDGLRGVAVVLVVLIHTGDSLWPEADAWLARGGALGVHLFFVLSGFLITTVLLGEAGRTGGIRLAAFAGRRARRLVPVLAALLAVLVAVAATGTRITAAAVASTAGYTLSFTANDAARGSPFPLVTWLGGDRQVLLEALHTWSLAIEVQFYVLWALCLWVAVRLRWSHRRLAAVTALAVVAVAVVRAIAFARGTTVLELYFATWSRLDAPLVGSFVGICFAAGWLRRPPRWLVPAGVVGLLVVLGFALGVDWTIGGLPAGLYTVVAVAAALAIAAVVATPECALARALAWRPLVALGLVSYSLYIWHYPIFVTVFRHDPDVPGVVLAVSGVAVALVVSALSYRFIERPFLRRPTARRAATVVVASGPVAPPIAVDLTTPPATAAAATHTEPP